MSKRPIKKTRLNGDDVAIGNRLRARRMQVDLSQTQVGKKLGVTFQQVQKYEKGVNRVSGSKLLALCEVLKCDPNHLLGWDGQPPPVIVNDIEVFKLARRLEQLPASQRAALRAMVGVVKVLDEKAARRSA